MIGFGTNFFQEHLYRYAFVQVFRFHTSSDVFVCSKNFATRGPEARLYMACCAAILMPCGMFIYAWSTFSSVPWIVLTIGITVCLSLVMEEKSCSLDSVDLRIWRIHHLPGSIHVSGRLVRRYSHQQLECSLTQVVFQLRPIRFFCFSRPDFMQYVISSACNL